MFRSINNKILGLVFGVLLIAAVLLFLFGGGKNERTFCQVLVDIDTTAVTQILIYPKSQEHKEVKLFKEGKDWMVTLPSGKNAKVTVQKIRDVFVQLESIKPNRLAARDESKWNELQVDSTGTRVKVYEGSKLALDIVLGRFSFQQPRSMNTFVRLYNDKDVYEVNGFLDMTFNQGANVFRDGTIIKSDYNNWQQLQFTYPADSSFQITKTNNKWFVNGLPADSAKTANYLRRLANLTNNNFVDQIKIDTTSTPTFTLNISTNDLQFIKVEAFQTPESILVHSSQNPEAWFDGANLMKTVFVGKSSFLK
jgi:hypothetical protein